jgi:hypothetical protein
LDHWKCDLLNSWTTALQGREESKLLRLQQKSVLEPQPLQKRFHLCSTRPRPLHASPSAIRTTTSTTLLAVTGSDSKACYTQTAVFVEYRVLADRYKKFSLLEKHGTHGRSFECSRSLAPDCEQSSATERHACSLAQAMKSKDNSQHILKMNEVKVTSNSSILGLES